jgi:hypothetical protein
MEGWGLNRNSSQFLSPVTEEEASHTVSEIQIILQIILLKYLGKWIIVSDFLKQTAIELPVRRPSGVFIHKRAPEADIP